MFPKQGWSPRGDIPKARLCPGLRRYPACVGIGVGITCIGCLGAGSPALLLHGHPSFGACPFTQGNPPRGIAPSTEQSWPREGARTSIPGATKVAGGQGGPGPGPLPAPGQSIPSIPAPWDCPILGTPIAEGSKPPKTGLGAQLQAGTDPCQGRAGGHRERHHALSVGAGTCAEYHCSFPLKRGKRWSFTPSSPSGPGGSLLARSDSAQPLPPLLAPQHQALHGAGVGTSRHGARLRGWGGGLQPRGAAMLSAKWVVGPDPGPAQAKWVLSFMWESGCLPAFKPHPGKLPWISIPGSLQPLCLLKSSETHGAQGPGCVGGKSPILQADSFPASPHLPAHWEQGQGSCRLGCEIKVGHRML